MDTFWLTAGLATAISLIVSGAVTLWTGQRGIHQQVVIEERRRWRDDIRDLVTTLVDPKGQDDRVVTRSAIFLRLNPVEDIEVMQCVDTFVDSPTSSNAELVIKCFQKYLKFEWTRAKKEASWWPWCAAKRARREITAQELNKTQSGV